MLTAHWIGHEQIGSTLWHGVEDGVAGRGLEGLSPFMSDAGAGSELR